ncbi:unnamed protein product, partial [Polarella glacialis]
RGAMALPGMDMHMPPSAAGEWPGAVSAKFTDKFTARPLLRKMVDTDCRNGSTSGLANNGFGRYFADRGGLIPTEGKRIAHVPASEVVAWRPSVRPLAEPGSLHLEKPEGRLQVEHAPGKVFSMPEKRHLRQVESKEEYSDRAVGMRVVYRENGLRAYDQPAREIDVQTEMQRKAKNSDLLSQRNGIGCRSLGDKNYRHPDYCGRFHQAGGLIVGSGFHRGMHSKTEPRNSTSVQLVMADGDRKPSKTYKEKLLEQEAQEAQAEVEELTRNWETGTLKECDEKYAEPIDSEAPRLAFGYHAPAAFALFYNSFRLSLVEVKTCEDMHTHVNSRMFSLASGRRLKAVSERGFGMEVLKRVCLHLDAFGPSTRHEEMCKQESTDGKNLCSEEHSQPVHNSTPHNFVAARAGRRVLRVAAATAALSSAVSSLSQARWGASSVSPCWSGSAPPSAPQLRGFDSEVPVPEASSALAADKPFVAAAAGSRPAHNRRDWLAGSITAAAFAFLALVLPQAARADENLDGNPIAEDLRLPERKAEELKRRRTSNSPTMKEESWYKTGQRTFVNNCAGCHAMSRESSGDQRQVLGLEYFERNGGIDEARIQYAIRYGKGKMPGYAADCGDENDNFAAMFGAHITRQQGTPVMMGECLKQWIMVEFFHVVHFHQSCNYVE